MKPAPVRPPLFMLIFFALFGCIGLSILIFMWSGRPGFGDPPLVFRVMGSFIAIGFMVMGFGVPLSAIRAAGKPGAAADEPGTRPVEGGYRCPNCGAVLKEAEVSPSGDVKCPYCKGWWNIHR